ncbi:MAG: peptidylprolyl isomerase [Saprospiraceae bacterium]|nr:peptidylprolyl isomerase [Saprospiraceae bacterium]
MGMIASIRKRLWVVTVLMALALVGFIVMDMTSGGSASLFNNPDSVGKAAGQDLSWREFQNTERVLYANSEVDYFGRKDYLWNQFVEKSILEAEAKHTGTGISEGEMQELQFGYNLSPIIQRNFTDPNTGAINREQLNVFKQGLEDESLDPRLKDFWLVQEKEVNKDRMHSKLNNLVAKSLYMPNFMVERNQYESNYRLDFAYGVIPYNAIDEEEIKIEESDYEAMRKEKEASIRTEEETRTVKLAILEIIPTSEDSATLREAIASKIDAFQTSTNDSSFIISNLGTWEDAYKQAFELNPAIQDTLFKIPVGSVYGPYIDNGEYRISKVLNRKAIPDSVKASHILIRVQTREQYLSAVSLLDSISNLVKNGTSGFDSLAMKFSQDQGSAIKGGDLGYTTKGKMVKPFNDAIFYQMKKGELKIVLSQFGLHLIYLEDAAYNNNTIEVHLGTIGETILPGEQVANSLYDYAQTLIQENRTLSALEEALNKEGKYKLEVAGNLFENTYQIATIGAFSNNTARDIVRWAFAKSTNEGDVSPEVYSIQEEVKKYTHKYVIAGLSEIVPKGIASIEPFRNQFKNEILKRKRYEKIKNKIGNVTDLTLVLGEYTLNTIDTAINISPFSGYITNYGEESKVISNLTKLEEGQTSQPLMGEKGVFVCKVLKKNIPPPLANLDAFRAFYVHPAKNVVMNYIMPSLKKKYKVADNRSKFF